MHPPVARTRGRRARLLLVASVALILGGLAIAPAQAALLGVPETGLPGHLSLRSDPHPAQFLDLSPGKVRHWQIAADLVDPYSPITLQVERHGDLVEHPRGLMLEVRGCDEPWTPSAAAPSCPAADTIISPRPASSATLGAVGPATPSSPSFPAGEVRSTESRYLLVSLWIEDTPEARADTSLRGLEARLGFGVTAQASTEPADQDPLPITGADPLGLVLLASGAIGAGLSAALHARMRREEVRR